MLLESLALVGLFMAFFFSRDCMPSKCNSLSEDLKEIFKGVESAMLILQSGVGSWKDRGLDVEVAQLIAEFYVTFDSYGFKRSGRHATWPCSKEDALSWSATALNDVKYLRTKLNEIHTEQARKALQQTGCLLPSLRSIRKLINERKELSGKLQMDAAEGIANSMLGAGMSIIAELGSAFIGELTKSESNRDSPSQIQVDPGDWSLSDVPRPVKSIAFKKRHIAPAAKSVVQQKTQLSMALQQRCQEKSLVVSFDVPATCSVEPGLIGVIAVSPQIFSQYDGTPTTTMTRYQTPLSYFGEFFRLWRGSLRFTFQVIASEFHQGQIFVAFNPNDQPVDPDTLLDASNLISGSFDISQENEFVLETPYTAEKDYKLTKERYGYNTATTGALNRPWNALNLRESVGMIWIYIQNRINAPPTVNPSFYLNVWIQAADSFDYFVPREPQMQVMLAGMLQMDAPDEEPVKFNRLEEPMEVDDEMVFQTEHEVEVGTNQDGEEETNPIDVVTQVETADTTNVMTRTYLVQTGVSWMDSQTFGQIIWSATLPELLFSKDSLAPKGLLKYHELFRTGFTVTIHFGAPKQYFGLAILVCVPPNYDRDITKQMSSVTQLPHAFLDIGRMKTVSLSVPWMNINRVLRVDYGTGTVPVGRLGTLYLLVVNPLRTPPEACSSVQGSVHAGPDKAYVGVKKVATTTGLAAIEASLATVMVGTLQMKKAGAGSKGTDSKKEGGPVVRKQDNPTKETKKVTPKEKVTTAATTKEQKVERPWKPRNKVERSFIAPHTSVYDLMKRPRIIPTATSSTVSAATWLAQRSFNPMAEPVGMKIMTTYAFWNGGLRLHATAGWQVNTAGQFLFQPRFNDEWTPLQVAASGLNEVDKFIGSQVWSMMDTVKRQIVIGLPYYSDLPLRYTPQATDPATLTDMPMSFGKIMVYYNGSGQTTAAVAYACSVGDDFEMHFPLPMPGSVLGPPVLAGKLQADWKRDLTCDGDVEKNPGPSGWIKRKMMEMVNDIIDEQVEKQKQKLVEFKNFLLKHTTNNIIEDVIVPVLSAFLDIALHIRLMAKDEETSVKIAAFAAIALRVYPSLKDGMHFVDQLRRGVLSWFGVEVPPEEMPDQWQARWKSKNYKEHEAVSEAAPSVAGMIAVSALAAVVGSFGFALSSTTVDSVKKAGDSKFLDTMMRVSKIGSGVSGIRQIWTGVRDGIATAMDFFIDAKPEITWWEEKQKIVADWIADYTQMETAGKFNSMSMFRADELGVVPAEYLIEKRDLMDEMALHFPRLPATLVSVSMQQTFRRMVVTCAKAREQQAASRPRCEPVGVWISGGAGTGKSVLCKELLPSIMAKLMNLPGSWKDHIYQVPRDPEQAYWDGYTGQFMACIDDFGQATDDKDFAKTISWISSATCPLNMARLEDKCTTLVSKMIPVSTNLKTVGGMKTVKTPDAVVRRFPVAVNLTLKDSKYKKDGRLDYEMLLSDMRDGQNALDVWDRALQFEVLNLTNGSSGTYAGQRYIRIRTLCAWIREELLKRSEPCPMGDIVSEMDLADVMDPLAIGRSLPNVVSTTAVVHVDGVVQMKKAFQGSVSKMVDRVNVPHGCARSDFSSEDIHPADYHPGFVMQARDGEAWTFHDDDNWQGAIQRKPEYVSFLGLLKYMGIAVGGALVIYFVVMLIRSFVTEKVLDSEVQAKYAGATKPRGGAARPVMRGQLNADEKRAKVERNVVTVKTEIGETKGLVVDNRHIIVPRHLTLNQRSLQIWVQRDGCKCQIVECSLTNTMQTITFRGQDIMSDAVMVRVVGANLDGFPSIRHLFMTRNAWDAYPEMSDGSMAEDKGTVCKDLYHFRCDAEYLCMGMRFASQSNTFQGDCGMPYFSDCRVENPLLGLHAGKVPNQMFDARGQSSKNGRFYLRFFAPLCREDVHDAIALLGNRLGTSLVIEGAKMENAKVEEAKFNEFDRGALTSIGQVTLNGEKLESHVVPTTSLEHSPVRCSEWSDDYRPSQKHVVEVDGVKIHPLLTNAQKYEFRGCAVSASLLNNCIIDFCSCIPRVKGVLLTDDEVLNGKGEMNRVVTKTSCGVIAKYLKKEELFDTTPGEVINGVQGPDHLSFSEKAKNFKIPLYQKSFVEHLQECQEQLSRGQVPLLLWTSTLKDELRPIEKVRTGKTRVFENPDFTFTLLCRRYFGDFVDWFKQNRGFQLHHAIGSDREVAAPGIYDGLKWKDRVFDVDYSNFDGTVPQCMFDFFLAVTDAYYGADYRIQRHTLIDSMRNATHVIGDNVYQSHQGNKSGNAMTDVFNSVVNAGLFYLSFHSCYPDESFRDCVRLLTYGDDAIVSVSPSVSYNRIVHAEIVSKLGLKVTPAQKGAKLTEFTDIKDVSFLKSVFRPGDPFFFPLPMDVIHRELQWQHKVNRGDQIVLKQRIENAMDMVLHHGEVEYGRLEKQITRAGFGGYITQSYEARVLKLRAKQVFRQVDSFPCREDVYETFYKGELQSKVYKQKRRHISSNCTAWVLRRELGCVGQCRVPRLPPQNEDPTPTDNMAILHGGRFSEYLGTVTSQLVWRSDLMPINVCSSGGTQTQFIPIHKTMWGYFHIQEMDGPPNLERYEREVEDLRHERACYEIHGVTIPREVRKHQRRRLKEVASECNIMKVVGKEETRYVANNIGGEFFIESWRHTTAIDWTGLPDDMTEIQTSSQQ